MKFLLITFVAVSHAAVPPISFGNYANKSDSSNPGAADGNPARQQAFGKSEEKPNVEIDPESIRNMFPGEPVKMVNKMITLSSTQSGASILDYPAMVRASCHMLSTAKPEDAARFVNYMIGLRLFRKERR